MPDLPVIVVEDDPFTRLIPLVLDPNASEERRAAFADFMSTDEPDFAGWCARVRQGSPGLYPAEVRLVTSEDEMRANLKDCVALVVESFRVGPGRSRRGAQAQGGAEIRHGLAQHRHRRLRREGRQAAHAAPPRQHFLRRARLRADADAGAQARRARRPRHRRADRGRPGRLPAVRPPPHARRQLRPRRRHPRAQRCDHRHHWPRRDRARDCRSRAGPSTCTCSTTSARARRKPRSAN